MNYLNRIIKLEKKKRKTNFDDNRDGFINALVGDDIEKYNEYYSQKSGWNIYAIMDNIAADVWSNYTDELEEI